MQSCKPCAVSHFFVLKQQRREEKKREKEQKYTRKARREQRKNENFLAGSKKNHSINIEQWERIYKCFHSFNKSINVCNGIHIVPCLFSVVHCTFSYSYSIVKIKKNPFANHMLNKYAWAQFLSFLRIRHYFIK